jgi:hypothetical protein
MRIAMISVLVLAALSVSCADSTPPPAPAKPAEKQKTVIDEQLKAIDKAKAVQDVMDQRTKQLDEQLKKSEDKASGTPERKDDEK